MTNLIDATDTVPMVVAADNVPGVPQGQWTYDAYAAIPDDGHRYEVINGVLYIMPAPTLGHQSANNLIAYYLTTYVQIAGLGRVFTAPVDVELATDYTVQPDVVVVLNANKDILTDQKIVGAPDLVVEISSPGTVGYDRNEKQAAYLRAGVREYWLADPATKTVEVLVLAEGKYRSLGVFQNKALLPSQVVPNLPVQVQQFFVS